MGAITGMLGVGGGASGTSFGGPSAHPMDPTGMANLQSSYQQLQDVAAGKGPNPAMAQYTQNVQDLAKQQSGAISSVQGISPALAARMISQQGSAAMQNAAAAGATNQAQQQLAAMGQASNVAGMQAGISAQMQQSVNNNNASLAQQGMQNQMGFIGGLFGGAGTAMQPKGAPPAAGAIAAANGLDTESVGPSRHIESGGMSISAPVQNQTQSLLSQFLSGGSGNQAPVPVGGPAALQRGMTEFGKGINAQYAAGGMASVGGVAKAKTPAQKAVKPGNSYANDKIPAVLSEGEVVLPRSVMQSPDPIKASADFVANVIAKRKARK